MLASTLALGAAARAEVTPLRPIVPDGSQVDEPAVEAQIVGRANAFRATNGLAALRQQAQLTDEARRFAGFLAGASMFSHTADGHTPSERAEAAGYAWCEVAENIAYEKDPAAVTADMLAARFVDGWERSPEHRKNLLNADVEETGVGVATSTLRRSTHFAVQVFGRPLSRQFGFEIVNRSGTEVRYAYDSERQKIAPHLVITYTACSPRELSFDSPPVAGQATFRPDRPVIYELKKLDRAVVVETRPVTSAKGGA